jgi:hypothetical protein
MPSCSNEYLLNFSVSLFYMEDGKNQENQEQIVITLHEVAKNLRSDYWILDEDDRGPN